MPPPAVLLETPYTAAEFAFHPDRKGLQKIMGELEADIMEILWLRGKGSVREALSVLNEDRSLAYTTVMTVMSRLADKKILSREKENNAFVYFPTISREAFIRAAIQRVVMGLIEDFPVSITASEFIDAVAKYHPDKMNELPRLSSDAPQTRMVS